MPATIRPCECKNDYQDKNHGRHNRVHNVSQKYPTKSRCTVCGKEKGS